MKYDNVVIGAGLSGLSVGIRFAHFSEKTVILEMHDRAGGLNSFYRAGGYDMDVGLHAVTNYLPDPPKHSPLGRLTRMLRIKLEDLQLRPQKKSVIVFPGAKLAFENDYQMFTDQVREVFPGQIDNFIRLSNHISDYNIFDFNVKPASARARLREFITEPMLIEMIMAPILFYGSPQENDIDLHLFMVLYKSVLMEGLCRPPDIRVILDLLTNKFGDEGGELRYESGVKRIITSGGKVAGVELFTGEIIESDRVISTVGLLETFNLCPSAKPAGFDPEPGVITLMESINVLDKSASDLGVDVTSIFYNKGPEVIYRQPDEPVDISSGVICFADNFEFDNPPKTHFVRLTHLANSEYWMKAETNEYYAEKKKWHLASLETAGDYTQDFRKNILFSDLFTPRTIKQYTGHINGAIYGSTSKTPNAKTNVEKLYICGTDQGLCGIVGAMISGIVVSSLIMAGE